MGCITSTQSMTKTELEQLKAHTHFDEDTIRGWYKGFKQDCPDGRLTPSKFAELYKMFFPGTNTEKFSDHIFRNFDTDRNGFIDFKEFLIAMDINSSGTAEERVKWAFRMYDVDGNGVIDLEEMTIVVQAIYDMLGAGSTTMSPDSAEERAKDIFRQMDFDGDGLINEDEFLRGCMQDDALAAMLSPNDNVI